MTPRRLGLERRAWTAIAAAIDGRGPYPPRRRIPPTGSSRGFSGHFGAVDHRFRGEADG